MYLTIKALVLRITDYSERDALLTLLTREQGILTAKVRGLRRKNSPLTGCCQLLAYCEFVLFETRGKYTVNDAHSIELFHPLRRDVGRLSLGTYFVQAAEILSQEDMPSPELLSLVLNCLYALAHLNAEESKVKAVFELRAACLAGYLPDLSGCHLCGQPQPDRFDISLGALNCSGCRESDSAGIRMPVTPGILAAMRYIAFCEDKKLFSFQLPSEGLYRLSQLTEAYLTTQLERGFSTLDFYKSLQTDPANY